MPDREKVIKGLECCCEHIKGMNCDHCPYDEEQTEIGQINQCTSALAYDALELLKEQEAVKPIFRENPYTHLPVSYCPKCREPIDQFIVGNPYREVKYCHYCGQKVKWAES